MSTQEDHLPLTKDTSLPPEDTDKASWRWLGGLGGGERVSLGLTWSHLDSLGLTWSHMESLGLAWSHLDSQSNYPTIPFIRTSGILWGPSVAQLGPNFNWRDPIVDPNDMKLIAVHVGGDASKQTAPTHAPHSLTNDFVRSCTQKHNWVHQLGPQLGQRLGPRLGPSCLKLGPNWVPP